MVNAKRLTRGTAVLMAATLALALCALCTALAPQKAWAYGVDQTAATENSVTVSWTDPNADYDSWTTTGYTLSWGKDSSSATNKVPLGANVTSHTITGLKPGTEYYVKVEYAYTTSYGNSNELTVGTAYDVCTKMTTPTGVKQTKWWYYAKSVDFKWDVQDAADAVEYRVYKEGSKKVFKKGSSKYPSKEFSIPKVSNNTVYTVEMRVHNKWGWSGWSKKAYLFTQPMVKAGKTKVKGNKLTVTWDKIKGATSYVVYVSTKEKKGYKKVATVKSSKNTVTVKKLGKAKFNAKKKYYVYVVAKKKVGKTTYDSGRHYTYELKGNRGSLRWTFD